MQQWRALLAFGNGGPWGVGLGNGSEKFGTLTFAHIDFIFPVVGEELGLVVTLGTVLCYVLIAVAGMSIAIRGALPSVGLRTGTAWLRSTGVPSTDQRRPL